MPASHTSFIYGSIFYLVFTALVLPYCAFCIYRFISISKSNWNEKYFRHRHPISNILFLLCFFVATFVIDPLEVILGIIGYEDTSTLAIIDIIYDLTSVIIFAIFICRVWFLFSDWSFHYNMSSWIWKREINPLETNCIIKYRQIFGNKKCCYLFIFFIIFLPIIIMLDIIPFFFTSDSNQILFRIGVVLLFIIFTLFILLSQLRRVLDVYNIRKELVYEICVYGALLLFSEIFSNLLLLTNTINPTQQILFLSILSLITNTLVIYIGTNWVLKQFRHYKLFQSIGQFQSTTVPHDSAAQKINTDDLIAILNTEQGFESFLLHLVNELQLEKMLFLIEVLQFKQQIKKRLLSMNVLDEYDKCSAEWLKLDYVLNDHTINNCNINSAQQLQSDILVLSQINIKKLKIPCDPRLPVWSVYQFAVHLYDKYIEDGAALQLGISDQCQRFIYSYFRARSMSPLTMQFPTPNDAMDEEVAVGAGHMHQIVLKDVDEDEEDEEEEAELVEVGEDKDRDGGCGVDGGTYSPARIVPDSVADDVMDRIAGVDGVYGVYGDQNVNVVYDLFRLYDSALYEVWNSISNQIFNRFKTTSEYGTIYERIYNITHIQQTNLMNNTFNNKVQKKHTVHSNSISLR